MEPELELPLPTTGFKSWLAVPDPAKRSAVHPVGNVVPVAPIPSKFSEYDPLAVVKLICATALL
jgi:hypothetical protein